MNNSLKDSIQKGFFEAKEITQKYAKTFYFASLFLPRDKRNAAYAVYAVCRKCDNSVDDTTKNMTASNLIKLKEKIKSVYRNDETKENYLSAFKETINRYNVPIIYFFELIDGMNMDLLVNRYKNFDQLNNYCYKVAGVVGLIMLKVFGYKDEKALEHAVKLGIAMQLTNILRDIKEDFEMRRIYMPQDEMKKYGIDEGLIASEIVNENFKDFMAFQIKRARKYYKEAAKGISMITNIRSRFVVCAMKDIYSSILDEIEKNDYDVFKTRAHVSFPGKIFILLKLIFKGEYIKDNP